MIYWHDDLVRWCFGKCMADKVYFLSDSHLGVPSREESLARERLLVEWLGQAKEDALAIYLLGDIFDFWFEYRKVVPRGYVRLLGKLAELADAGIPLHYFTGNHDMWAFDYLVHEVGLTIHRAPVDAEIMGKRFHIGHGDGLGPGDKGYKLMKSVFSCAFCQRLFAALHPRLGIGLAEFFSRKSRIMNREQDEVFLGEDKEWLILYAKEILKRQQVDFFIFGHRHLPVNLEIAPGVRYINTGDWVRHFSYAVFDGRQTKLLTFADAPPAADH